MRTRRSTCCSTTASTLRQRGRRSRTAWTGTLAKDEPPVLGLIRRGGQVVLRMLANVQQKTIEPIIGAAVARNTLVYTDEYDIYARLEEWGYGHKTVCHARGEYARDDDGDRFCEVHVNTAEGVWSLLRSWLRPHRGVSQEKLPLYLAFLQVVHNARRRGKALPATLAGAPVAPTLPQHPGAREGPAFIGTGKADLRPAWLSATHIGAFP